MWKCGTIQISNHLHTVEHVVQSKSFLCFFFGGGGGATALMAKVNKGGITNYRGRSDRKKIMCLLIFCTDATYKISSS